MPETKTITLRRPLSYGKGDDAKSVTEITVREPTAGEYEQAEKAAGVYGWQLALIALQAGVPVDVIDRMYGSQIDEAADFIGAFGQEALLDHSPRDEEVVIDLIKPVNLTTEESPLNIASLTLSEPTNQQRRKANAAGGVFAASIALISAVSGTPKSAIRALCARDFMAVTAYFNSFQVRRAADSDD